jgi:signal peptidase I
MAGKTAQRKPRKPGSRRRKQIWETTKSIVVTVAFVWLFTNHAAQATVVPSESMSPSVARR